MQLGSGAQCAVSTQPWPNGVIGVVWMAQPAPNDILELVHCGSKTGCRCACEQAGLVYIDACKRDACNNKQEGGDSEDGAVMDYGDCGSDRENQK